MKRGVVGPFLTGTLLAKSKKLLFLLRFILLLSLTLVFSSSPSFGGDIMAGTKAPAKSNDRREGAFELLKESARRLEKAIEKGEQLEARTDHMINEVEAAEAADADNLKKFQEIEEKLKSIGSPKIMAKHRKVVEEYKKKSEEFKRHAGELKRAKREKASPENIKTRIRNIANFIEKNKAEREYVLHDSSNRLPWRTAEPGEILLLGDVSGIPQPAVPSAPTPPPTGDDLSQTPDIQITPEIQELANSLGNQPLQIFRYVYNNFDYTPYYGSMKGSLDTYWEKEGNDYDLASLLIALLRASGVPSRYVKAKIILPIDAVRKWVGIDDPMLALAYLSSANIPIGYYTQGGGINKVEVEHVYVEAYVPYSNYRGTGEDDSGKLWIPLDPSVKKYNVTQEGVDLASLMGLDWKTFSDEYIGEIRNITPMEFYKGKVDQYISQNYPGQSVDTLKRVMDLKNMQFDFLPNTLPYAVKEVIERTAEIPQTMRHNLRFTIPNVLDYTVSLPEVSGRRITLSFEGATPEDQAVIDQYGNIFKTPPYLIDVKPVLRISGNRVAEGVAMNAGISASFNITYTQPEEETETLGHRILTGSYNAVGITTGKVRPEFLSIAEVEASEEPYISKMLHSLVMKYHDSLNKARQTLNDTMKIKSKTFFMEALVSSKEDIRSAYGIPLSFDLGGFTIDAKEMATAALSVDGKDMAKKQIDFAMVYGHEASYQENKTFEDSMFWVSGLSAVKGLQILKVMGVNILELEPHTTYANPNLPSVVVTDINNALHMGWKVMVPEETGGLPAVPYIKYDAKTGSAGYMIATMAGGFNWNITPTGYETDLTFVKDVFMSNNIKMKYELLFPNSPYQVAMGDSFILGLRVTAEGPGGVSSVHDQMIHIDTDLTHYLSGKWPVYALIPGKYSIKFDGRDLFEFDVWGVRINSAASGNSLQIVIQDGVETITEPVTIAYTIESAPGLNISSAKMFISGDGSLITRDLPAVAGNGRTIWDGENNNDEIVPQGDYNVTIVVQANGRAVTSNSHKVVVNGCNNVELTKAYASTIDSYVAVNEPVRLEGDALGRNCSYKYNWDFKDGATSLSQNPLHQYQSADIYYPVVTASCDQCPTPTQNATTKIVVGCSAAALSDPGLCCLPSGEKVIPNYPIQDLAQCPNRVPNISTYVPTVNGCGGAAGVPSKVPNNPMYTVHFLDPIYKALHAASDGDFMTSCNSHDLCYGKCNAPKSSCDINFGLAMDAVCYKDYSGTYLIECLTYSAEYDFAVTNYGGSYYEDGQKAACSCCKQ